MIKFPHAPGLRSDAPLLPHYARCFKTFPLRGLRRTNGQLPSGCPRGQAATLTRSNRPLTVACHDATPSVGLLGPSHAFVAGVLACLLALGFPLRHTARGSAGGGLTHHAPDARVRRGGRTRWRLPGPTCPAVCTVRPPVVWRYRTLRPDVARAPLWAPHGGRSLHRGAPLAPPRAPGPRAPSLGPGAAEPGGRCDAGCPVSPGLSPGRCHAPPRPNGDGGSAHHQQRLGALALGLQRVHEGQRLSRILGRVSPRSPGAGAGVPGPGGPHRWLGEYDQA